MSSDVTTSSPRHHVTLLATNCIRLHLDTSQGHSELRGTQILLNILLKLETQSLGPWAQAFLEQTSI